MSPIIPKNKTVRTKAEKASELLYYGQHICETLARQRREAIIRVYCTEERLPQLKSLLQWCAAQRKAYHVVTAAELEKISGSVHHEGLAILARTPAYQPLSVLRERLQKRAVPLVCLDGVQNPHNIGTMMRIMASFGWPYLVGPSSMAPLSAAAARMSEGGAEFVSVFTASSPRELRDLAQELGYTLFGTSSHESTLLYQAKLPARSILVLGHEVHGMSSAMEKEIDQRLAIPSTGQVESLNVAVATGILLGEYTRQNNLILP